MDDHGSLLRIGLRAPLGQLTWRGPDLSPDVAWQLASLVLTV